jgi:hypothetical protein
MPVTFWYVILYNKPHESRLWPDNFIIMLSTRTFVFETTWVSAESWNFTIQPDCIDVMFVWLIVIFKGVGLFKLKKWIPVHYIVITSNCCECVRSMLYLCMQDTPFACAAPGCVEFPAICEVFAKMDRGNKLAFTFCSSERDRERDMCFSLRRAVEKPPFWLL